MPVNLSIKAVPDALAAKLRARAERHHRSLQRELMAIVEEAVQIPLPAAPRASSTSALSVAESEAMWHVNPEAADDSLLEELDGIVAGSRWGEAPLLTREQLHERALARELDYEARQTEAKGDAR